MEWSQTNVGKPKSPISHAQDQLVYWLLHPVFLVVEQVLVCSLVSELTHVPLLFFKNFTCASF